MRAQRIGPRVLRIELFISLAQSSRAARSFATSMKKFMPIAQKNDSRGAKRSTSRPA